MEMVYQEGGLLLKVDYLVRMPVIRLVCQQGGDEFGQDAFDQIGLSAGRR